jgi:hypothetical protein
VWLSLIQEICMISCFCSIRMVVSCEWRLQMLIYLWKIMINMVLISFVNKWDCQIKSIIKASSWAWQVKWTRRFIELFAQAGLLLYYLFGEYCVILCKWVMIKWMSWWIDDQWDGFCNEPISLVVKPIYIESNRYKRCLSFITSLYNSHKISIQYSTVK